MSHDNATELPVTCADPWREEHISFKATPFNKVRPDVNISFMWAKRNPVRELAGGWFHGRRKSIS